MMSDIVERLRNSRVGFLDNMDMNQEAADEIERLRATLERLIKSGNVGVSPIESHAARVDAIAVLHDKGSTK